MKKQIMIGIAAASLMVGCATREYRMAELRDLPVAVQHTIQEQAPGADISHVEKENRAGRTVYAISFQDPIRFPEMHVASNGALLKGARPIIIQERAGAVYVPPARVSPRFEDLPLAVQNTIRAHAPNARIVDIDKEVRTGVVYEVELAEPGPKLHITEDGTLVRGD